MAANPAAYWRLGETSGSALDWTGYANDTVGSGVTRGVTGALSGDTDRAARFTGSSSSRVYSTRSTVGLNRFSVEAWFKTTSTSGGEIVGFANSSTLSDSTVYDRQVYLGADGKIRFGVNPNSVRVVTTPGAYNDGNWHHVVATLGAAGMNLYVDGAVRATLADTVSAQVFTGYWRIGGDSVAGWPGAGDENLAGDIDDVAVYARALTPTEVAAHQAAGTGGVLVNQPPTADFTATGGVLTASVDATASSDPDGTITSYAWDFGDGGTGTGVTADHPYATGGTYPVTLTVTDNSGAKGSATRDVVVRNPNEPPVAAFTTSQWGMQLTADGASSSDPDGSIASYAWDFGDGTAPGTGSPTSHVYATAGKYPVTLTVTDNSGATGTTAQSVTIDPAAAGWLAADTFTRSVTDGFGTAELGGAWTSTAGATSVVSGAGQLVLGSASSLAGARLPAAAGTDLTTQLTESWDKAPNGSGGWFLVRGRITTGGEYRLKIAHKATGAVTARLVRTDSSGAETGITAETTVSGLTYTGTPIAALFQVTGTNPTTLRAKVWAASQTEPAAWFIDTTDATSALQVSGHTGIAALLSSSTTNLPVTVRVDDYSVIGPTP
jgi:PKD repeat protein